MAFWQGDMKRKKIPPKVDLRPEFERRLRSAPQRIRDVLAKGQGYPGKGQACCVAFTHMEDHIYRGTWGSGSVRFLHCICKMLDGGIASKLGTTMLTGIRAEKGWWTCDEDLWVSNVDLSVAEFEDWRSIPPEAWKDAKNKRIRRYRAFADSRQSTIVNVGGQRCRLVANFEIDAFEKDKQVDILVMDDDYDALGWAQVRAYVDHKRIVLEDLFVKPEIRRKGIGSELLRQIEQVACFDKVFREVSQELTVPIPTVDIWLPLRNESVREFYKWNGYAWDNSKVVPGREYSIFTATKKLSCAQIPTNASPLAAGISKVLPSPEPIEGPCAVHLRVFNSDYIDAWVAVYRP
jgi:GNAT superfamily N-acetyltransferase